MSFPQTVLATPVWGAAGAANDAPPVALGGGSGGASPTIGSLCTGYAGLDQAVQAVLGGTLAWVADPDPGAAALLAHHHPGVPNLGDITVTDWARVPQVNVVCAGFPCQDISYAGRGEGIREGNRSGLWHVIADALAVLRPGLVVLENVAAIVGRRPGLDVVLADLAALGFDADWTCVRASDVGAPHRRERWFLVAIPSAARDAPSSGRDGAPAQGERGESAWATGGSGLAASYTSGAGREAGREGLSRTGGPAADAESERYGDGWQTCIGGLAPAPLPGAAADADRGGFTRIAERDGEQVLGEADDEQRRLDADGRCVDWGRYRPAIERWERTVARSAPDPREPAPKGGERLSPRFVEWLMGLPAGHVTDVHGLTRNQQLRLLGNGVVPQQGAAALRLLLDRVSA